MGDETVFDSDETLLDDMDRTVFDGVEDASGTAFDGTVYDSDETFYEEEQEVREAEDSVGESDFQRGRVLLKTYRIDSDAFLGGMGSVWRVFHESWNTMLAMKRPKSTVFFSEAQKACFISECEHWINLGLHPNIVSCYYVRVLGGIPTIFSEWMKNGSLEDRIKDGSLYEGSREQVLERLLDIGIQFARGLKFAHSNQLIHQDVKPDNLLLSETWEAKVSDFGLAKVTEGTDVGGCTPAYCSPEQALRGKIDHRTDIYSFGVSVLEMFLGDKPWAHGRDLTGPMVGFACGEYFLESRIAIPERLQKLLQQRLQQKVEDRPADFEIVEKELREIYQETVGTQYPRKADRSAETGNSLNNRAISYFDLGRGREAEELLREAWEKYPSNASIVYNYVLVAWRSGKMLYDEAWGRIETKDLRKQFEEESDLSYIEQGSEAAEWTERQKHDGTAECVSPDGKYLAVPRNYKTGPVVEVIPLPKGSGPSHFINARGWITAIGFLEDGNLIFATRIRGTRAACRCDIRGGHAIYTYFPKAETSITDFDSVGTWAVAEDGTLFDVRTGCNAYHYGFLHPYLSRDGLHVYDDECKECYPTPRRDSRKAPWSIAQVFDNQEAIKCASQFEEHRQGIQKFLADRDFTSALGELEKIRELLKTMEDSDFELEYYRLNREVGEHCKIGKILRIWQEELTQEQERSVGKLLLQNQFAVGKKDRTFSFQKAVPYGQRGKAQELLTLTQGLLEPSVEAGCISKDGTIGVTGLKNGQVAVWDLQKKTVLLQLKELRRSITAVSLSEDNKFVVAADERGTVCVWKLRTGEVFKKCEIAEKAIWHSFAFDSFYEYLACGGWNGEIAVIDLNEDGNQYHFKDLGAGRILVGLTFSLDGERLWSYARPADGARNQKGGFGELILWSADLAEKLTKLEPEIEVQQIYLPEDQYDIQVFCGGRYLSRHYPATPPVKGYLAPKKELVLYELDYQYLV